MTLRIPVTIEIDEEALERFRRLIDKPVVGDQAQTATALPVEAAQVELPPSWRLIEERHGVRYTWGEDHDIYDPFRIYEAEVSGGMVRLAIGKCDRARTFSEDRIYYIVTSVGPAGGIRAISEFLATDDYEDTGDVIAVIKGKEGTARQFDSSNELPPVYDRWSTVIYRNRVDYPGAYLKQALVCNERDYETMLNHSLAQIRIRNLDA